MRFRVHVMTAVVFLMGFVHAASAQRRTLASFNGAWREVGYRIERPDSTVLRTPEAGISVIYNGYFSQIHYPASQATVAPRPTTAEEKAARYDAVTTNAGHFEITDSTATLHTDFAKGRWTIGSSSTVRYRLIGDTLWETTVSPWAKDSSKTVRATIKYVRIK